MDDDLQELLEQLEDVWETNQTGVVSKDVSVDGRICAHLALAWMPVRSSTSASRAPLCESSSKKSSVLGDTASDPHVMAIDPKVVDRVEPSSSSPKWTRVQRHRRKAHAVKKYGQHHDRKSAAELNSLLKEKEELQRAVEGLSEERECIKRTQREELQKSEAHLHELQNDHQKVSQHNRELQTDHQKISQHNRELLQKLNTVEAEHSSMLQNHLAGNRDMLTHTGLYSPPFDIKTLQGKLHDLKQHVRDLVRGIMKNMSKTWGEDLIRATFSEQTPLRPSEFNRRTVKMLLHHRVLHILHLMILTPVWPLEAHIAGGALHDLLCRGLLWELRWVLDAHQRPDRIMYNRTLHLVSDFHRLTYDRLISTPTEADEVAITSLTDDVAEMLQEAMPDLRHHQPALKSCVVAAVECQLLAKGAHPWIDFSVSGWPFRRTLSELSPTLHTEGGDLLVERPFPHKAVVFSQSPGVTFTCSPSSCVGGQHDTVVYIKEEVVTSQPA